MLKLISYSAIVSRDDAMLKEQREIPFTIADKRVFVPLSLLEYGDNHEKVDRAMSDLINNGVAPAIELELPMGFALANGLPMPASETGVNVSAQAAARQADPERGSNQATIVGGATGPGIITHADGSKETVASMRHNYRVLSDAEKSQMQAIKDEGLALVTLLHGIGGTDPTGDRQASRELSVAQTKIEEAVMWAVKHITR